MCWGQSKPMGEGDRIRTLCILASQGLSQRQLSRRRVKPMHGSGRLWNKRTESEEKAAHSATSASNRKQTFKGFFKKFSSWPCHHQRISFCSITISLLQKSTVRRMCTKYTNISPLNRFRRRNEKKKEVWIPTVIFSNHQTFYFAWEKKKRN